MHFHPIELKKALLSKYFEITAITNKYDIIFFLAIKIGNAFDDTDQKMNSVLQPRDGNSQQNYLSFGVVTIKLNVKLTVCIFVQICLENGLCCELVSKLPNGCVMKTHLLNKRQ